MWPTPDLLVSGDPGIEVPGDPGTYTPLLPDSPETFTFGGFFNAIRYWENSEGDLFVFIDDTGRWRFSQYLQNSPPESVSWSGPDDPGGGWISVGPHGEYYPDLQPMNDGTVNVSVIWPVWVSWWFWYPLADVDLPGSTNKTIGNGAVAMSAKPVDEAIRVVIGPILASADGAIQTSVPYNASGMSLTAILEKTDGTIASTNITPATSGDYAWSHIAKGFYSLQLPASGGGTYNNNTLGLLRIIGTADNVMMFGSTVYSIVPRGVYESAVKSSPVEAGTVADDYGSASAFDTDLTEATDDHYTGAVLAFTSGALAKQSRKIADYAGSSKTVTVSPAFTEAPANGDTFVILGRIEE